MTIVMNERILSAEEEGIVKLFTDNGYIVSIERESVPLTAKQAFKMYLDDSIMYRLSEDGKYIGRNAREVIRDLDEFVEINLGQIEVFDHDPTELLIRKLLTHLLDHPNTFSAIAYLNGGLHALRMSDKNYYTVDGIVLTYEGKVEYPNESHLTFKMPTNATILPYDLKEGMDALINPWSVNTSEYDVKVTGGLLLHPVEDWDMTELQDGEAKALLSQTMTKSNTSTVKVMVEDVPAQKPLSWESEVAVPKSLDQSLYSLEHYFRSNLDKFCVSFQIGMLVWEAKMDSVSGDIYVRTPMGTTTTVAKADPNVVCMVYSKGKPMEPKE